MAWPTTQYTLMRTLWKVNDQIVDIKKQVRRVHDAAVAGPVNRHDVLMVQKALSKSIDMWNEAKTHTGIAAYVQDQFGDSNFDAAAEFNAMIAAATTLRDWIYANFPTYNGAILMESVDSTGSVTQLTFTSAQLADFITNAETFLATID